MPNRRGWRQPGFLQVGTNPNAGIVPSTRRINTTAPLTGGGDLSADRTLGISPATAMAAGSMSAADFAKLAAIPWDLETYLRGVASAALGVSAANLIFWMQPFSIRGDQGVNGVAVSGGTRSYQQKLYRMDSGGAAGGAWYIDVALVVSAVRMKTFLAGAGVKWWTAARFRLNTAVGAGATMGFGAASGAAYQLIMGGNGNVSTTHFSLYGAAGASIDSGIALDFNLHTHMAWNDGTNSNYMIDANAPITGTAAPAVDGGGYGIVTDTAAVSRTLDVSWFAIATVAP